MSTNPYDPPHTTQPSASHGIPEAALPALRANCRILQIITFALPLGVGVFAAYALSRGKEISWAFPGDTVPLLMLVFGSMTAIVSLVVSFLVPIWRTSPEQMRAGNPDYVPTGDPRGDLALEMVPAIQARTIISAALLEGGAFGNLTAFFLDGTGWSLVLAGVLFALLVLKIPTFGRYLETVEAAMRRYESAAGSR
jgi:hypothetical protein